MNNIKERDFSIDILKFLAVFFIINSHMDTLYTNYKMLATGGSIGDTLFLFCSGYTLLLNKNSMRFDNWYKRRIIRIYPSVIVCALMGALFSMQPDIHITTLGGGEFVIAIMIYYILIYFIKVYAVNKIPLILAGVLFVSLVIYTVFFPYKTETGEKGLYGITTLYRWIPYFAFMLIGAYVGMKRKTMVYNPMSDFIKMISCLFVFYGVQYSAKINPIIAPYQIITLLPLVGIVFYFYKWCNAGFWGKVYQNKRCHAVIMTISGLCLESYLIQYSVFTTSMNSIFPLNLPIMVLIVLLAAFVCKCLSRVFAQTFKDGDYDWRSIIKPY